AAVTWSSYHDTAGEDTTSVVSGSVPIRYRDFGDSKSYSITGGVASSESGFTTEKTSAYGTLYLNSTSGAYKFVANDAAIEGLKTDRKSVVEGKVMDGWSGTACQTQTLMLI